ncbi:uncharacterized protein PHACADRAFT_32265 [Phanerochaete carnosa HHB-10118-sp]|uniref:F-box domain-containing protein n=1 Tax=Phanerochaete carnosa (strain HHB-10118-sp) TaxID=650164 RepID=K5WLW5_PHACS|nr:uncharacterized protein PHACADRAFT_32265 [Phanerochaete carnosa HHB-10118-sp]EKM51277.1 hypothetical protein PHACADRAFT_32265 [Phanerochaete carnosa HHB-10118-sp]
MASSFCVPEELLLKILSYNLVLSDDAFTGHAFTDFGAGAADIHCAYLAVSYPLADITRRSSPTAQLLVCRRWARVGTPLLYEAAVLRTHAQLHAFARALHGAAPGPPGTFVHRLRFGASCGAFLDRVVPHTPRVHTLAFSLNAPVERGFHSFPYPSAGLRAALAQLHPRRLLLEREGFLPSKRVEEMMCVIRGALVHWDSLVRRPLRLQRDFSNHFTMDQELAIAMSHSQSLQYVSMFDDRIARDLGETVRPSCLAVVAQNPKLKAILCRGDELKKEAKETYPRRAANLLVHDPAQSPSSLGIPQN